MRTNQKQRQFYIKKKYDVKKALAALRVLPALFNVGKRERWIY